MYLTLIHMSGGGSEEIAHAWATIGPFSTYELAENAGEAFYHRVAQVNDNYRREVWHSVVKIPDPAISAMDSSDRFLADVGGLTA